MDAYKLLGVTRTATKQEIKSAFKKLAIQHHPDKHSHSSQSVKEAATLRFKLIAAAYDTLIDDRRRADYNIRSSSNSYSNSNSNTSYRGGGGYNGNYDNSHYYKHGSSGGKRFGDGFSSKVEALLGYLTTRDFLRSLAFAGVLVGGAVVIERSRDALWKMRNSGKSLEEALEAIEKAKTNKDQRG
ncbi:hypothetical protein ACFE04_031338 [Oxalis oulophora]